MRLMIVTADNASNNVALRRHLTASFERSITAILKDSWTNYVKKQDFCRLLEDAILRRENWRVNR